MSVDADCTALPNGGPKLHSFWANPYNYEKGFRAGGVSTGDTMEDDRSITNKSNKAKKHNQKEVKRERTFILTKKG